MKRRILIVGMILGLLWCSSGPLEAQQQEVSRSERARQLFAEGRYQDLVDSLSQAPVDGLSAATLFTIGSAYTVLNEIRPALRYFRAAAQKDTANLSYRLQLARMLVEAGMLQQSQTEYEAILARDPKHNAALVGFGHLLFDQRQFKRATEVFERALTRNPRDFLANYLLGASLFNRGLADSAFAFLAVAQTLNPYYVPAIALLALIQFNRNNFGEAARLYRAALAQQSNHADLWYRAGLCYYRLQELTGAKRCFSQASWLDSANSTYLAHLGLTSYELKQFDSARIAFEAATAIDEDNPTLYLNLGLALARIDSVTSAVAAFRKAIARYGPPNIARVYNEMGALFFSKERYRNARAAYQKALTVDPKNRTAMFYLAFTLDQLGDYKRAVASYNRYVSIAVEDSAQRRNVAVAKERLKLLTK